MSSTQIYEDQENIVPPQRRGKQELEARTSSIVPGTRRPVLGAINPNLRKQPTRAAKQGVSYETGVPQVGDENVCPNPRLASSQPFTIHEDESSCVSMGSSGSTNLMSKSITSVSLPLQERLSKPRETKSEGTPEIDPSITMLQKSSDIESSGSTDVMEMSVCEDDLMVVETTPREDVLHSRNDDIYDVPEYAADIYQYLKEAEVCHKPRANYMSKQTDITASMRWILVDWLVEVAEEYSLHTETLYLAVSYIDRFLSHMSVKRDKLQLVGTTAMFIAAKYEEIYPPDVGQFAYITDNTYKVGQILRMEHLILKVLSFDMAVPTAHLFVNKFSRMCKNSEETLHLSLFLAELSMLDCDPFLRFLPSMIAASAVALANHTTQARFAWPQHMAESTGYTLEDLRECYVNLYRAFSRVQEPQQHAIRDKYKSSKWHGVSQLVPRQNFPW
ncbi:G2/mitotic-specific cyclin-A [Procambarus clarkii]|uniref:G2/mitotic-specific cyclin-A n=1 Tax=Procambarus clarkii TaxID=6728 RepID=UPI001E676080|nr:G2/mitotic-specific cyclin-A-like [Procambarus clarkii]